MLAMTGCKTETQSACCETSASQGNGVFPGQTPSRSTSLSAPTVSEWAKVKIDAAGAVFVNKKQMTLDEFKAECFRLKKAGGAIMLFVVGANHVANPAQADVIRLIADAGVPMQMAMAENELE